MMFATKEKSSPRVRTCFGAWRDEKNVVCLITGKEAN
jgi:hypothetical protein